MRKWAIAGFAGIVAAGIASAAPARADANDTSINQFCYGGWRTEVMIDWVQRWIFVEDTCGDVGDIQTSYYRF
ncbi:MAG TPA: hypothetical protein VMU06_11900 [Stellaceae bacterium]|nr:hypothetical protein [Stellaceae bacterium]